MRFMVLGDDGVQVAFECGDTWVSRWVCGEILEGKTYPVLPFVDDVRVVFDVGANCGAASVYFARHYPQAIVHAFEPAREPREVLERNAASYPNVIVHPFGLFSEDREMLRAAGGWVKHAGIDRIDVMKIDVEGCEVDVIESLAPYLPSTKVLYVEYDSTKARRTIDNVLNPTHDLYSGALLLSQGECLYVRSDYASRPAAADYLHRELMPRRARQAAL